MVPALISAGLQTAGGILQTAFSEGKIILVEPEQPTPP